MKKYSKNTTFLDVRTPSEFREGHIPNAINIPLDQVQTRIQEINSMPPPIVIYCRSGNRSELALTLLKQKGVHNVLNGGGIEDLKRLVR